MGCQDAPFLLFWVSSIWRGERRLCFAEQCRMVRAGFYRMRFIFYSCAVAASDGM